MKNTYTISTKVAIAAILLLCFIITWLAIQRYYPDHQNALSGESLKFSGPNMPKEENGNSVLLNPPFDKVNNATNNSELKLNPIPSNTMHNFPELFENNMLFQVANIGENSARFEREKKNYYRNATSEQREKGRQVLSKLHSVMGIPASLKYKAIYLDGNSEKIFQASECLYKSPSYYREEMVGATSYEFITNGNFEITNYMQNETQRRAGVVPCDTDEKVFLEMFPCRMILDKEFIWQGRRNIDAGKAVQVETEVLGNWFYDIYVRTSDYLVQQVSFYNRFDRTQEIVSISNIVYDTFTVPDHSKHTSKSYKLPVSYTMRCNWDKGQTYSVKLEYKEFNAPVSINEFDLILNQKE